MPRTVTGMDDHETNEREPLLAPLTEPTEIQDELITGSKLTPGNDDGEVWEQGVGDEEEDDDTPLPMDQILGICYIRLVEPIAFFSIFAFLSQSKHERFTKPFVLYIYLIMFPNFKLHSSALFHKHSLFPTPALLPCFPF